MSGRMTPTCSLPLAAAVLLDEVAAVDVLDVLDAGALLEVDVLADDAAVEEDVLVDFLDELHPVRTTAPAVAAAMMTLTLLRMDLPTSGCSDAGRRRNGRRAQLLSAET